MQPYRVSKIVAVVILLFLLSCGFGGCKEKPGDLFSRTLGFDVPAGLRVLNEKRFMTWESLFSEYYAELEIDDSAAFQELCSRLRVQRSQSVRSLPFARPKGLDWWLKMPTKEAEKNPNRFLWEGENNEFLNINVIGNKAYLMKIGQSVRR